MIITTVSHGRTGRDARALLAHLGKEQAQAVRVVEMENIAARSPGEALRVMQQLRDGSRAEVAFQHISLNPRHPLTPEQRDEAVARIVAALGAEEHGRVLWEHADKARAKDGGADHHFHLVVAHVGPDLRALDMSQSYARLEAVARSLELDWGEELTPTRRHRAVAAAARRLGREDVALAVTAQRPEGPEPPPLPQSGMSSRTRARAERAGLDLPAERAAVAAAWAAADGPAALRAALAERGLDVVAGEKPGVWLVQRDGALVGALDRLAGERRAAVAARMAAEAPQRPEEGPQHVRPSPEPSRAPEPASGLPGASQRGSTPAPGGGEDPPHDRQGRAGGGEGAARPGGDALDRGGDPPAPRAERGGEPGPGRAGAGAAGAPPPGDGHRDARPGRGRDQGAPAHPVSLASRAEIERVRADLHPAAARIAALARSVAEEALPPSVRVRQDLDRMEAEARRRIEAARDPAPPGHLALLEAERRAAALGLELAGRGLRDALAASARTRAAIPRGLIARLSGGRAKAEAEAREAERRAGEATDALDRARERLTEVHDELAPVRREWERQEREQAPRRRQEREEAERTLQRVHQARQALGRDPALARRGTAAVLDAGEHAARPPPLPRDPAPRRGWDRGGPGFSR